MLVRLKNHLLVKGVFIRAGIVERDSLPVGVRSNKKLVEELAPEDVEEDRPPADEIDDGLEEAAARERAAAPHIPIKKKYKMVKK